MAFVTVLPHEKSLSQPMKNLFKSHETLAIFPLKYSQDFNGFWFPGVLGKDDFVF